jgi:hypothetical protein
MLEPEGAMVMETRDGVLMLPLLPLEHAAVWRSKASKATLTMFFVVLLLLIALPPRTSPHALSCLKYE